ncbi:PepSY domain-containing protein [Litchfieldia alkalitelluris]|uniref:PepSY domain-containing protein n=1 Tax=Litchfieldia alkalitelluris TaxID=304268 RepID=UPI0009965D27|nr:PepSY domain-containing protein [Litchfieldia alkalitelluris]
MNWRKFLLGVSIGFASGYLVNQTVSNKGVTAENALKNAKNAFKEIGPVTGSWIHMVPEDYRKNELTYKVYKGGISRELEDQLEQFEFIVDATTGTIIDINRL